MSSLAPQKQVILWKVEDYLLIPHVLPFKILKWLFEKKKKERNSNEKWNFFFSCLSSPEVLLQWVPCFVVQKHEWAKIPTFLMAPISVHLAQKEPFGHWIEKLQSLWQPKQSPPKAPSTIYRLQREKKAQPPKIFSQPHTDWCMQIMGRFFNYSWP